MGLDAELDRTVPAEKAAAFLLALTGGQPGRVHPLARNTMVLGRAEAADIRILDASVSVEHARIINGSQGFEIEDLGSTNGTFVDGERVRKARLQNGQQLLLGEVEFTFLRDGPGDATMSLLPSRARRGGTSAPLAVARIQPLPSPGGRPPRAADDDDQAPLSLTELVRRVVSAYLFLRPYLPAVVILVVLGMALGGLSAWWLPPPPVARCEVRLQPAKKLNPVEGPVRGREEALRFFSEAGRSFVHPELVRSTLTGLPGGQRSGRAGPRPDDALVGQVQKGLRLEPLRDWVHRASYRPPLRAENLPAPLALLDAHVKNYVQTDIDRALQVFTDEARFLRQKLVLAEAELTRINGELAAFRRENSDRLPDIAVQAQASRFQLEARRSELAALIIRLEGAIEVDERQLAEESPLAQSKLEASQVYRDSAATLNGRLSEAYARGLADGHPEVRQLKAEKQRIEALIEAEMTAASSQQDRSANAGYAAIKSRLEMSRAQLRAARKEDTQVGDRLSQLRSMVSRMPTVAARLDDLQRAHDATKRLHDQLFDQVQKADLQVDIERLAARSRYEVITPPFVERATTLSTYGVRIGVGLLLGLLLAGLIIVAREGRKLLARTLASMPASAPGRAP